MYRKTWMLAAMGLFAVLLPASGGAVTRDLAELRPPRLTFDESILNQLSYGTYRDPYDELQTRPYNLLFANIGRHPNLSPWEGQEGLYSRYLNALIGNNGAANVDNDADAISGSLIRRERPRFAWGVSGSFLAGTDGSADTNGASSFSDTDELVGFDVRGAAALQISESRVLGFGAKIVQASHEVVDSSFEQGVGGFFGADEFSQIHLRFDAGMRTFITSDSSWEVQGVVGFGQAEQDTFSDTIDDTGTVTDRFVVTRYDIMDLSVGFYGGYNKLKTDGLGETEFRGGVEYLARELDNSDLSFLNNSGAITPNLTLLAQDTVTTTSLVFTAKSIFQAGETEMFTAADLAYAVTDGSTQVDAAGLIVNEAVDDTLLGVGVTIGLRQPLVGDKLRFIVSGRADFVDRDEATIFDTSSSADDGSISTAQYALGLEGVLANVVFDLAWLNGDEAPVTPVSLGLPAGSRRSVEVDRLIFSAAVSW